MVRHIFLFLVSLALFLSPVSAGLYLSPPVLSPPETPLEPSEWLVVNATLTLIPAGPTTFEPSHDIQVVTGLLNPTMNAQVMVDGQPAAWIPAHGGALFINGFLLSYPTSSTVEVELNVQGTVPQTSGGNCTVLSLVQIGNTGSAVPGSRITLTEPISMPTLHAPAQVATSPPTVQSLHHTPSPPPPTPTPGFPIVSAILSLFFGRILFLAGIPDREPA